VKPRKKRHLMDLAMQDHTGSPVDNAIAMQKYGVGQPVRRKEDDTLVRGKGKYTDDFDLPGQLYAWIVRSPHAHGHIRGIDTAAAKAMPGVRGVWTGKDLEAANYGPFTCGLPLKNRDGSNLLQTNRTALMTDKVRFVGDPVAFVVADTVAQARDAAEAVELDIEALPAVTDCEAAIQPGAPLLWDHIPNNVALDYHYGDADKVEAAFASAAHVTKLDITNTRVAVVSMEPRCALASYDKAGDRHVIQVATQGVAGNRNTLAKLLNVAPDKVRILTANVGGSFGMKNINYPEYICLLHAAKELGRPVKWLEERSSSFLSDSQGRSQDIHAELALDADGKFLAVRLKGYGNLGAYISGVAPRTVVAQHREESRQRLQDAAAVGRHQMRADQHDPDGRLSRRRPARSQFLHGAVDRPRRRGDGHRPPRSAQAQFYQVVADAVRGSVRRHL
jgi:aerobic carbon-monoxide dehydrogenase large subunit